MRAFGPSGARFVVAGSDAGSVGIVASCKAGLVSRHSIRATMADHAAAAPPLPAALVFIPRGGHEGMRGGSIFMMIVAHDAWIFARSPTSEASSTLGRLFWC